jgi:DNA helicase-2/ATP-dependent DNA helicase PcrA
MGPSDWCEIAKKIGVFFSVKIGEEGIPRGATKGDALLTLWSLSRVMLIPLQEVWTIRSKYVADFPNLTFQELEHFITTVRGYKETNSKLDYTDMLELFISEGQPIHASHVVVDEAQDLSPLQWAVVNKLCEGCVEFHLAGDDDQAIHEWNGASPSHFIKHKADYFKVLPQSFRIPAKVHQVAASISSRIKVRLTKDYHPRGEPGSVVRIPELDCQWLRDAVKEGGSWFFLVRNHGMSPLYAKFCREQGLLFSCQGGAGPDMKALTAIKTWKLLQLAQALSQEQVQDLYAFMGTRDRVAYGMKTAVSKAPANTQFTYGMLTAAYGLLAPRDMLWDQALDKIVPEDRAYFKTVEARTGFDNAPKIEIATIHAVKGREADNVVILPDMTNKTFQGYRDNPDAEHRVWYVGVTRAKNRLITVEPMSCSAYQLP